MERSETLNEYNFEPVNANQVLAAARKHIAELESQLSAKDEELRQITKELVQLKEELLQKDALLDLKDALLNLKDALIANLDARIGIMETLPASEDSRIQSEFIKLRELEAEYLRLKLEHDSLNRKLSKLHPADSCYPA